MSQPEIPFDVHIKLGVLQDENKNYHFRDTHGIKTVDENIEISYIDMYVLDLCGINSPIESQFSITNYSR